jgi:hypothetical protein
MVRQGVSPVSPVSLVSPKVRELGGRVAPLRHFAAAAAKKWA